MINKARLKRIPSKLYDALFNRRNVTKEDLAKFFAMINPVATNFPLVRIGGNGDGGYLVPDDLQGIKACFSPGVSTIADFEEELVKRQIPCYLTDYSVKTAPIQHQLIDFQKKFLGTKENNVFTTMQTWVAQKAPNQSEFILQMDIEGAEYDVFNTMDETLLQKFRIIAVEFHSLDRLTRSKDYLKIFKVFEKLQKYFEVVHIHPNNYCKVINFQGFDFPLALEITFLRKDRVTSKTPIEKFPHPLDIANTTDRPDVVLSRHWYAKN